MGIYLHINNITIVQSLQCVLSCSLNFVFFFFNMQTGFKQHYLKKKKTNSTLHSHNSRLNTKYTFLLVSCPLQHLTPEEGDEHGHTDLLFCCPLVATKHNKYIYIPALQLQTTNPHC